MPADDQFLRMCWWFCRCSALCAFLVMSGCGFLTSPFACSLAACSHCCWHAVGAVWRQRPGQHVPWGRCRCAAGAGQCHGCSAWRLPGTVAGWAGRLAGQVRGSRGICQGSCVWHILTRCSAFSLYIYTVQFYAPQRLDTAKPGTYRSLVCCMCTAWAVVSQRS